MTPDGAVPEPARAPTLHFLGVSTGSSSIRTVFPRWAEQLGLGDVQLSGVDLPVHAPAERYRAVVDVIARDPLSRGALVTTHKLDLYEACTHQFGAVDPLARLMREVSCLSKRDGTLVASAKDPISAGLALEAIVPAGHWQATGADAFVMGAGGSAIAISWYLTRPERGVHRPRRVVVSDLSPQRLGALARVHEEVGTDVPVETVLLDRDGAGSANGALLAGLPAGSLVVNATGLGKDAPGSPLGDGARFPEEALAWDLNYRGDLVFLDQARAQAAVGAGVTAVDGWTYFLHGWTQVIADVFEVEIPTSGPGFEALGRIAAGVRQ